MSIQVTINNPQVERTRDDFFPIIQIAPIPEDIKLSKLLLDISPHIRDVIGIMRIADYKAKRQGETVFLYCINHSSAKILESIKLDINNQFITPTIVPMKVGRANFVDQSFDTSYDGVPISIILKGLERQKETTIYYVMELAKYFEEKGVVTGARLGFNNERNWSTNQGFITFLRQADARSCSGEGGYVDHMIAGRKLRASLSENIPMLVSHEDLNLFKNGIIDWGEQAEAINQLIMTFEFPMHLAEKQTVKKKDLIVHLHEKYRNVTFPKHTSKFTSKNLHVPFSAKRARLSLSNESPKESSEPQPKKVASVIVRPQVEISKPVNVPEVRDSPESPFEDIVSDSDEEVLQIDLDAEKSIE